MQVRQPVVERALELARSGQFRIPSQVRSALVVEGYALARECGLDLSNINITEYHQKP